MIIHLKAKLSRANCNGQPSIGQLTPLALKDGTTTYIDAIDNLGTSEKSRQLRMTTTALFVSALTSATSTLFFRGLASTGSAGLPLAHHELQMRLGKAIDPFYHKPSAL